MDTTVAKLFVELTKKKRRLDAELKKIKERISEIEPLLLNDMVEGAMQSMKIDGTTLYIKSQLWAGVSDGATYHDAVEGLRDAGLGDLVEEKFNTNRLSAYFREQMRDSLNPDEVELPKGIKLTEKFSVGTRS